jgi:hypothetical protein
LVAPVSAYAFVIGALVGLLVGFGLGIICERDRGNTGTECDPNLM